MRQITQTLRNVPTSVDSYTAGRKAFQEGVSFTDLPRSDWDLQRSGYLDAMADMLQNYPGKMGEEESSRLKEANKFTNKANFGEVEEPMVPPIRVTSTGPEEMSVNLVNELSTSSQLYHPSHPGMIKILDAVAKQVLGVQYAGLNQKGQWRCCEIVRLSRGLAPRDMPPFEDTP